MPTYAYTARDASGAAYTGTMAGDAPVQVLQALRAEGKFPVSVQLVDEAATPDMRAIGPSGIKISRTDVLHISSQIAVMIETGVTLSEALDCIARQSVKPDVKALMDDLVEQLQSGIAFSEALRRHPRSFPVLFVALIRASEKTGMMSKLLNRACAYLRDERDIVRRVKGALTYPAIMLAFALSTTIFLLTVVLPRFTMIYATKQAALPLPTLVLMRLSEVLVNHWPVIIASALTLVSIIYVYLRTEGGQRLWHGVQLKIPIFGKIYQQLHLSRGMRMVGTMAGAGVSLMECVTTAQDLCDNTHFKDLWRQIAEQIQVGRQLSDPLFASPLVPRSVAQMIHSGEKGGKLAYVMEQISGYAEQELKDKITAMTRYIEPAMIIVMGVIIGGVSLALLLPIFTIGKVMAH